MSRIYMTIYLYIRDSISMGVTTSPVLRNPKNIGMLEPRVR